MIINTQGYDIRARWSVICERRVNKVISNRFNEQPQKIFEEKEYLHKPCLDYRQVHCNTTATTLVGSSRCTPTYILKFSLVDGNGPGSPRNKLGLWIGKYMCEDDSYISLDLFIVSRETDYTIPASNSGDPPA